MRAQGGLAPNVTGAAVTDLPYGLVAELSCAALAHVAAFPEATPAAERATRLYLYNRLPLSPAVFRSFPDQEAVTVGLLGGDKFLEAHLERDWQERSLVRSGESTWRSWTRRGQHGGLSGPTTHKLYVSPSLQNTPLAFRETLPVLGRSAARAVKVGRSLDALIRPDKLVAYFTDLAGALEAAAALGDRLAGMTAQGVPFTCAATPAGLISWGMDPPHDLRHLGASWRLLVTRQLAEGITSAAADTQAARVAAGRQRAEQLGIDPVTWRPGDRTWELLRSDERTRSGD